MDVRIDEPRHHTATVQVALKESHRVGSYEYMQRMRTLLRKEMPQLSVFFQSGGMVDAVLNQGMPAPIDVQLSGSNMEAVYQAAAGIASQIRQLPGVSDVYIPQDLDYPSLRVEVDRERAAAMGQAGKQFVASEFNRDVLSRRFLDVLDRAVAGRQL